MKIGILQTGHASEALQQRFGNHDRIFEPLLAGHGFTFQAYAVVDGVFPDGPEDANGWLITGSRHGAYEDLPWIPRLEQLIRDIHATGRPLVGVCFGHQIIAQALGGRVEKFAGGWATGRTAYRVGDEVLHLNAWHQDQVIELPPGAKVLGGNDFCPNAILAYDDSIWTIQPHPEFGAEYMDDLIRLRGPGLVPDAQLAEAQEGLCAGPVDNARIGDQIAGFFKQARA